MKYVILVKDKLYICNTYKNRKERIMTTLEIKAELKQDIDNEQDNTILEKVRAYYRKLKKANTKPPCQFTLEELNKELDQAEDDIKNGRVTSHEQLLKEIETW